MHNVGETGKSLTTRMKVQGSLHVSDGGWQTAHEIELDDIEILDTATGLQERKVKEAVYIRLAPKGLKMSRDEGKELSRPWIRTIVKDNCGQETTGHHLESDDELLLHHQLHNNRLHLKDRHQQSGDLLQP